MPFHFCQDELLAILAAVPFATAAYWRWRAWLQSRRPAPCRCGHDHAGPSEESEQPMAGESQDTAR